MIPKITNVFGIAIPKLLMFLGLIFEITIPKITNVFGIEIPKLLRFLVIYIYIPKLLMYLGYVPKLLMFLGIYISQNY